MTSAWPNGKPSVGDSAEMSRTVRADDIALFTDLSGDNAVVAERLPGPGSVFLNVSSDFTAPVRPGDTITGRVEVEDVRDDKPITTLTTTVTRDGGTVALQGSAVCWTMPVAK